MTPWVKPKDDDNRYKDDDNRYKDDDNGYKDDDNRYKDNFYTIDFIIYLPFAFPMLD